MRWGSALRFGGASGDLINCGTGAGLDTPASSVTFMAWIFSTDGSTTQRIYQRGLAGSAYPVQWNINKLTYSLARTVSGCLVDASHANFANFHLNAPLCIAGQLDTVTSANCKLFMGDLHRPIAEPSSYVAQTAGSGTIQTNPSASLIIGNRSSGGFPFLGSIWCLSIWNEQLLSYPVMVDWQFNPRVLSNPSGMWVMPGAYSTGVVLDLSGYRNHGAVTGAVPSATILPLPSGFLPPPPLELSLTG